MNSKRLYNLDYLRGLCAFGIMLYHYLSWTKGDLSATTFMGRLGIYGVSIFYILSGLTLFYVYYDKMNFCKQDIISFAKKRIFRIFPLLWLVTFCSIVISRKIPDLFNLFLNLSGLFGFVRWTAYFSAGVWSIGNELVFYAFFPFFILFSKRYKWLMIALSVIIFSFFIYFSFFKLTDNQSIASQWGGYINPLNQVFLFLAGFFLGLLFKKFEIKNIYILILLLFSLIMFVAYPTSGVDKISLVTGVNRLIFSSISIIICLCFFKLNFKLPMFFHHPLKLLGEASYSVYLLHPLVWSFYGGVHNHLFNINIYCRFLLCIISTLFLSYFIYIYFETYFIQLGRTFRLKNLIK
ncbi:acyltransferase [Ornithobacterium rhinotracheale]|uniref:acyltransferase family protein n=1 Tax=Ornithobacterium rhinotracheale TaxID=28251 RepID=UPI00129D1B24|nr:acyltransferase [Ornithobacterium rhinotracheale]MRJ09502.1 acyltransferase [Ornithobacterium rhinotracheale]